MKDASEGYNNAGTVNVKYFDEDETICYDIEDFIASAAPAPIYD